MVVNTPFTIVKNYDGRFYLYGAKHWYVANSATGPYEYTELRFRIISETWRTMIANKSQNNTADKSKCRSEFQYYS